MRNVDRSTIWPYDEHGDPREFFYQRYAHPTGAAGEARLGELEGGEALLFASGMAAETAVLLAFARPGMTVALAEGAYFGTSVLLRSLEPWGLSYVEYDQTGPPPSGADIVWVEAPANPTLTVPDWEAARAHEALVVCDATASTPVYLRALDQGADIVIHSGTKFLTGSHNALLGAVVTRSPERIEALRTVRTLTGSNASPHSAASLLTGLDSLERRMRRITETATEIAGRLDAHPAVGARPLPRLLGADLVRCRRPAPGRDPHPRDHERDEPRRRQLDDGEPPPLGGRPDPGGVAPAVCRARGCGRALGGSRAGALVKHATEYLTLETPHRRDYVNITDRVEAFVRESGIQHGLVLVNPMHITAAVYVNDDEDGLIADIDDWLERLAPHEPVSGYRHNRGEDNADAHLKRQLMAHQVVLPITDGSLDLGPWEQVFYAEFDGRRRKRVVLKAIGE